MNPINLLLPAGTPSRVWAGLGLAGATGMSPNEILGWEGER